MLSSHGLTLGGLTIYPVARDAGSVNLVNSGSQSRLMPKEKALGWTMADDVLNPKDLQDGEARKAVALLYDQVRAPIL